MSGAVGLQGGAEFGPSCREMDLELLRRAGGGPVVVAALAAAPGHEHDSTVAEAVGYYTALGASEVVGAPDARTAPAAAVAAIRAANLVVVPGGSPSRLLEGLRQSGVDDALRAVVAAGGVVSGASAGAMALCAWTVLPERGTPRLVEGLGILARTLVLPHFSGDVRWLDAVRGELPDDVVVLGLPECAGVVAEGPELSSLTAVGAAPSRLLGARDELLPVGATTTL